MDETAKLVGFKELMQARARHEEPQIKMKIGSEKVGVHISDEVGAHRSESVGVSVDAHRSESVGAKTPTKRKSGRPQKEKVDAHKKDRHAKNRARISLRPEAAILKKFKEFCLREELDMQDFFELAGVHYIQNVDAHRSESVGAKTPIDDRRLMIIYKSSSFIINLYRKYNEKNSWKPMDDREAERFNNTDLRLIEAAIIITQFNAGFKRVHSFKYYVPEIENLIAANMSPETLDAMLTNYRRNWQNAKDAKSKTN